MNKESLKNNKEDEIYKKKWRIEHEVKNREEENLIRIEEKRDREKYNTIQIYEQ